MSITAPHSTLSFHLFPHLPPELRLHIWTIILSQPRTVSITCQRDFHPTLRRRYAKTFSTSAANPALLLVNREARAEALRVYHTHFRTTHAPHQAIYIAFDREVLRLREDVLVYLGETELKHLQWLVVDVADIVYFGHFYMDVIRGMGRLRRLKLVVGRTDHDRLLDEEGGDGRLERGVEMLKEEFRETMARDPEWRCPEVRIVMRGTGMVVGVIKEGRGYDGPGLDTPGEEWVGF